MHFLHFKQFNPKYTGDTPRKSWDF